MPSTSQLFKLRHLPQAALAVAVCGTATQAFAQVPIGDYARGEALYKTNVTFSPVSSNNCATCHGEAYQLRAQQNLTTETTARSAVAGAIGGNRGGMGAYSIWTPQQVSDVAAYIAGVPNPSLPPPFAQPPTGAPSTPKAEPSSVTFSPTAVGSSTTLGISIKNESTTPVTFHSRIVSAIPNPLLGVSEFVETTAPSGTTACVAGSTLAPGASCMLGAKFAPLASGTRTGSWLVQFTNNVLPRSVVFTGSATGSPAPVTPPPVSPPPPVPAPAPVPGPAPVPSPAPSPSVAPPAADSKGGGGGLHLLSLVGLFAAAAWRRRRE